MREQYEVWYGDEFICNCWAGEVSHYRERGYTVVERGMD